jgi:hypothetical protein
VIWDTCRGRRQQIAGRPTHIHDRLQLRKIIGSGDCGRFGSVKANHRFAEHRSLLGMLAQPVKNGHAQQFLISAFPGLNRIQQLGETLHPRLIRKVRIVARAEPGAPVLSASPKGVKAKRCDASSVSMPRLASVHMSR